MTTNEDLYKIPFDKPDCWYTNEECQNIMKKLNGTFKEEIKYIIWIGEDAFNTYVIYMSTDNYLNYIVSNKYYQHQNKIHKFKTGQEFFSDSLIQLINKIDLRCTNTFKNNIDYLLESNCDKSLIEQKMSSVGIIRDISNIIISYIGFEISIYNCTSDIDGKFLNLRHPDTLYDWV